MRRWTSSMLLAGWLTFGGLSIAQVPSSLDAGSATIRVLLDGTICRAADTITVLTVATQRTQSGTTRLKRAVAMEHVGPECRHELAGIPPGEYEVWVQQTEIPIIVRQLSVGQGEVSEILVDANTVVSGTVMLNGEPLQSATIEFAQNQGQRRQIATARTDSAGQYQVFLAADGPYAVQFSQELDPDRHAERVAMIGQDRDGVANPGINHMDWLLEGGTLVVLPVGWDGRQSLELLVERVGQMTGVRGVGVTLDSAHPRLVLSALPPGNYRLQWLPPEADGSPARVVTLDSPGAVSVQLQVPSPKLTK